MKTKLDYTFDDEPVSASAYDAQNKTIDIHFNGYHDLQTHQFVDGPCVWTLSNWTSAKVKVGDNETRYDLDSHMGAFNLILHMTYNESGELEMLIQMHDNRYVTLFLRNPVLSLQQSQKA